MSLATTRFHRCRPTLWQGRYARVYGDTAVFHLRHDGNRFWPMVLWDTDEGRATCWALECDAAAALADAVCGAKRLAGGPGGGCFLINEFGQVLIPASDGGGARYLAGRLDGGLLFDNPFDPDEPIDLSWGDELQPGDPWKLPYVGVQYNLHRSGKIYFYRQDEDGGGMEFPPRQDASLIKAIRSVRPYGAVRVLVNPAGRVLTRRPPAGEAGSEDLWPTVYVGTVTPSLWFTKE